MLMVRLKMPKSYVKSRQSGSNKRSQISITFLDEATGPAKLGVAVHPAVAEKVKEGLRATRLQLDPLLLLSGIRAAQSALATLASPEERSKVQKDDLSQFLSQALSPLARGRRQSHPGAPSVNAVSGGGPIPIP